MLLYHHQTVVCDFVSVQWNYNFILFFVFYFWLRLIPSILGQDDWNNVRNIPNLSYGSSKPSVSLLATITVCPTLPVSWSGRHQLPHSHPAHQLNQWRFFSWFKSIVLHYWTFTLGLAGCRYDCHFICYDRLPSAVCVCVCGCCCCRSVTNFFDFMCGILFVLYIFCLMYSTEWLRVHVYACIWAHGIRKVPKPLHQFVYLLLLLFLLSLSHFNSWWLNTCMRGWPAFPFRFSSIFVRGFSHSST